MASTVMETPDVKQTSDPGMRFGHPRGLSTLFFTEVWERFSYYGLPALLLPIMPPFFAGLFFIIVGTGLLKPNVSSIVGQLYDVRARVRGVENPRSSEVATLGAKRDAGSSIFYMGINMGAIVGPFICGTVGEKVNYHWGFSIAGFGM